MHGECCSGLLVFCVIGFVTANSSIIDDSNVTLINLSLTDGTAYCPADAPSSIVSPDQFDAYFGRLESVGFSACLPQASKCAWICTRDRQCTSFNYNETSAACEFFHYVPLNYTASTNCAHFRMNVLSDTCPTIADILATDPRVSAVKMVTPQCCSFPFTYKGALYTRCAQNASNSADVGCFTVNRIWVTCLPPAGFSTSYINDNITVPNFSGTFTLKTINSWIIIQQRFSSITWIDGSWQDYKNGYGGIEGNFWFGLEKVYQMTNAASYRLRIVLEASADGTWFSTEYDSFVIDSESNSYAIHVSGYSGDGGDSFNYRGLSGGKVTQLHNGKGFTTVDADHDTYTSYRGGNCAVDFQGAFWHDACLFVCLTCSTSINRFIWRIERAKQTYTEHLLRSSRMMIKLA